MDPNKVKALRRKRRKQHVRKSVFGTPERPRLTVKRTARHIYGQVIDDLKGATLVSASSLTPELRAEIAGKGGNRGGAEVVGALLGRRAKERGILKLTFDRNGYKYHGRVAAFADAIRKQGIEV